MAIEAALAAGATVETVCAHVGIGEETYYGWVRRYPEFAERVSRARESGVVAALTSIQNAGRKGDWRASEAFLRLTRPTVYGTPKVVIGQQVKVDSSAAVQRLLTVLKDEVPDADALFRIGLRLAEGN